MKPLILPLLPLRDIVVFPGSLQALFVGRPRSVAALEAAIHITDGQDRQIVLSAQRTANTEDPSTDDLHALCTIGTVRTLLPLQNSMMKVLVAGERRARITRFVGSHDLGANVSGDPFAVQVETVESLPLVTEDDRNRYQQVETELVRAFEEYTRLSKRLPPDVMKTVLDAAEHGARVDVVAGYLPLKPLDKQGLLEQLDALLRAQRLLELLESENDVMRMQRKVRGRFQKKGDAPAGTPPATTTPAAAGQGGGQEELQDEFKNDINELEEKLKNKPLTDEARERVAREIKKLRMMSMMSAEATVLRSYLDWVGSLPWQHYSTDTVDIGNASRILDEDHYGLEKVKERVLEHLAVQKLAERMRGPILCLVGPPGVGKTSLAKSIARATGREFVRLSLGGVRDEAEIRGHRRTYIGALPGKFISSLKRAGTSNPVLLLDEIDKLSQDFRGDPAAALLEVLDPEQNHAFADHYLDLDYDLSKIMFIATANSLQGISGPLQDRLEVIRLSGYTDLEKQSIARQYLIPKQLEANGLIDDASQTDSSPVKFDDAALKKLIHSYTRESGVRNLEREIGTCCRKAAIDLLKGVAPATNTADDDKLDVAQREAQVKKRLREEVRKGSVKIGAAKVRTYLGTERFQRHDKDSVNQIGVTNGLAWTSVGGEMLMTEVTVTPGRGKVVCTGKLGDVMQESAQAAMSYVRSRATSLGLHQDFHERIDVHIHVPEGATPKDGPSAGITIATSLVSALTRIPVRHDVAMTGEITLRGRVMPIGGLKEKSLAAHRAGCQTVIIPSDNQKDLADIPDVVKKKLTFVPATTVDDVLRAALDDSTGLLQRLSEGAPADVFADSAFRRPPATRPASEDEPAPKVH
jgi:ATP-dependent Lon protease